MVCSPGCGLRHIDGRRRAREARFTPSEKIELSNKVILGEGKSNKVSWQYAIKPDTLREWVKRVKAGDEMHEKAGRPSSLALNSKIKLAAYVAEGVYNVKAHDFVKKVHQMQIEDAFGHVVNAFGHVGCRFIFAVRCQR